MYTVVNGKLRIRMRNDKEINMIIIEIEDTLASLTAVTIYIHN